MYCINIKYFIAITNSKKTIKQIVIYLGTQKLNYHIMMHLKDNFKINNIYINKNLAGSTSSIRII